ncbi:neuroblast differentiation-associated protein AHNAK-like [Gadus chalcogrammus]|uniref:neuroblast differentiation-associated protein AHNAK-like n=1 Tax=Gadus chalcogrammus TaxID=1042646 RepID=UPI0024C3B480|nr:neuroblast differentiation-associated protein AHNAK-like [Gadus chalcogrammus]
MCDCFHLSLPNWHAAPAGGRRLQGREPGAEDDSLYDQPSEVEEKRPRPQGSSPVDEFPEAAGFSDSDKEGGAEHDLQKKGGKGGKRSGLGSLFDKRSSSKMSKLKEVHSPESEVIVKTAEDGGAEGLIVGGGGRDGIFITQVVPESPAFKNLSVREGDQILSATVYFDNVSYEDALQIMEHAQAYKVKLCLKRKQEVPEEDPDSHPETIQEEEVTSPEMREQRKTKRPSDARISWPKFPSLGKGRKKSHFRRSHSTSEAEDQTRLELSPTTSDTDTPIKSQEALKGKKKHKVKLNLSKNKGSKSAKADHDTDTLTTAPLNGVNEDPMKETSPPDSPERQVASPPAYLTHQFKIPDSCKLKVEQGMADMAEPESPHHRVELISVDSTLKTADITAALVGQDSPTAHMSPSGKKKKKKEKSELKMKIKGKDKSHKQDVKAKSSPKRLQTLGGSVDVPDPTANKNLDATKTLPSQVEWPQIAINTDTQLTAGKGFEVISAPKPNQEGKDLQKVEFSYDTSDVGISKISPRIGKEKPKKEAEKLSKGSKQKTDTKRSPFKLPTVGFTDIGMEDIIEKTDVKDKKVSVKIVTEGPKQDPYERLSCPSQRQLPKREEMEIPGMEDASSAGRKKQGTKDPKGLAMIGIEELNAETVQMSIDVKSVKEAVSKLPGFKLPQVDTDGVPIIEEITMIDANAQRITVKTHGTPTKMSDTKTKEELTLSRTKVQLPNINAANLVSHDIFTETEVEMNKENKEVGDVSSVEMQTKGHKRENILIHGEESRSEETHVQGHATKEDAFEWSSGIYTGQNKANNKDLTSPKKTDKAKSLFTNFGVAKPDIRFPDLDIALPKRNLSTLNVDEGPPRVMAKPTETELESKFKNPSLSCSMPKAIGTEVDLSVSKPDMDITLPEGEVEPSSKVEVKQSQIEPEDKDGERTSATWKMTKFKSRTSGSYTQNITSEEHEMYRKINIEGVELNASIEGPDVDETTHVDMTGAVFEGRTTKIRMPNLGISTPTGKGPDTDFSVSKPDVDITLPKAKADITLSEVKLPSAKVEVKGPEIETEDFDGSSKFKLPKFKLPKFGTGSSSITAEMPEIDKQIKFDAELNILKATVDKTAPKVEIEGPSIDLKSTGPDGMGKGSKIKMPSLGLSMPKLKGPEVDFNVSKPEVDTTLPEAKYEVTPPDVELTSTKVEVKGPDIETEDFDSSSTFKMPKFKLPKFGTASSSITAGMPDIDKKIKFDAELKSLHQIPKATVDITTPKVDFEGPSINLKSTGSEGIGKGRKIQMPSLGLSMRKVKGPEVDLTVSKPEVDITLPKGKAKVNLPEIEVTSTTVQVKGPDIDLKVKDGQGSQATSTNMSVEIPEGKKEIISHGELNIPEARVEITAPKVDIEGPSIDLESTGKGSKFKMPNFGISMPKVKGADIDFGVSRTDVDITLPKAKADVTLPDVELPSAKVEVKGPEIETEDFDGSSTFKMPKFKLPKFGTGSSSITAKMPEVDKQIKFDAELNIPKATVDITAPKVDFEGPSIDLKSTGPDGMGKGSKIKMPSLGSMPKVKGPEVDFNASKTEVDIKLPEDKYEVALPYVELTSTNVEVKGPEIDLKLKDGKGSPSKYKMPSFKFPKFGAASPNISVEIPEVEKEITLDGELIIPEAKVEITAPNVDIEGPSIDLNSTGIDGTGKGGKFKLPNFGISMPKVKGPDIDFSVSKPDVNVTLPKAKADVTLTDVVLPSSKVDVKGPEIEADDFDGSSTFKLPKFKLPKFGTGSSSITAEMPKADKQIKFDAELNIPKATVDITAPKVEVEGPSIDLKSTGPDGMGKGTKIKIPSLGLSMPKVKGPEVDFNVSKPEVDITLSESKYEVALPDVELTSTIVEVKGPEIDLKLKDGKGSPSKFKMPSFKFPKFGAASPNISVEIPEVEKEITLDGELNIPEAKVEITAPNVDIEGPSIDLKSTGIDGTGKGGKFKMPNLGITMPKVKGPDIDFSVSKPDVDITLPKAKADITLTDVELPSGKVEVKGPEIETEDFDGSSTFKMPKFKLPKFGTGHSSITAETPEVDKQIKFDAELNIPKATVDITAPKFEVEGPSIDLKSTGTEGMGKGTKFEMPSLGLSMPKVKGPEVDFNVSKPEMDITIPGAKYEVALPDVELTSTKVEVKGPEIDLKLKDGKGSPSKFKMPSFKFPKFGAASPNISVEIPEMEKEITLDRELNIPEAKVEITAPNVDIEGPSIDLKSTGIDSTGKGSKFKMPNLGISMPKVKGPDIDFSVSKPDVNVTLPKAKADVTLTGVELPSAEVEVKVPEIEPEDFDGSSTFKMPKFKLPKFGTGSSSITAEMPDVDKQIKFDAELNIPKATVDITAPRVEVEGPSIDLISTGPDGMGKGSKIKMPSLGLSMPKVKGPEVDFNVSKPEMDITIPGAKYEVALPDVELPSTKVEVKGPEIDLKFKDGKGSPSKFKMPSFKFPKFGAASPNISVEIPEVEKEMTIDREMSIPEAKVEITAPKVEIEGPSIDLKSTGIDGTGKGGKFKMPNLGISMPKVKGPDIDFSVSKPDVNITLPKAKADVTLTDVELPSAKVEVKGPEIETEDFDGSSTFKMPRFKLPKFGTGHSSITAETPEVAKQIKFDAELNIPKATVDITAPKFEVEGPSIDLKSTGTDGMGKGTKFEMPSLGLSMPKVKGPEVDFNVSKPEMDITIPGAKYEVALPDVELTSTKVEVKGPEIDLKLKDGKGSPSKFKMPSFKFPKFGAAPPNISVEIPEVEKEITLDGELNIPEARVEITAPNVDIEGPSIDLKSTGIDGTGKGSKFKMPNLGISMPKVKGPDIDFSVSKPDVNVTLPKAKADVTLTGVELPSAKVEVKMPEIEPEDFDGSSTFKMPKFKLPKFGTGSSSITAEMPDVDKQIKFDAELNIPKATVDITAPRVEVEGPSIDLISTGPDGMGKGSKIKMPSLGLSMPKVKGPEVDFNVSKPEMDITIPGAKYEVALPDIELPSTQVEVKGPEIDLKLKDGKGSPSKFKMPSFKFPKFGAASPNISVEIPEVEKEITLDRELNIPEAKVEITAPNVEIEGPSIDLKSTGIDGTGKGGKFKMPNLGISMPKVKGPEIDFSVSKPDVNVTLPKAKADVTLTDVELPSAKVEVKGPEIETEDFDGSSTFKMPKFKLPKFGTGSSSITAEMPEVDKQIKFDAELNIPKATVDITAPKVEVEGPSIDLKSTGTDGMGKGSKIKMPSLGLSMPKVKGPEVDFNLSKPEVDLTLPESKYEVALPDVELISPKVEVKGSEIDLKLKDGKGSPSKFKMPSFKFPKFGAASPKISVEIPEVEKEITLDGELNIPEAKVEITAPIVDIEGPSIDLKSTGIDGTGKGGKFKMPNLGISMPKVKGPEIDFSVSKPDVNVTLPKAKADVTLTDVELPSAKVEVKGPEIETEGFDGSSTFKMPKFKLPKFGTGSSSITAEMPEVDKQIKFDAELNIPKATVDITAPKVEVEGPSIDLKSTGTDGIGKGSKIKMPSLGLSMPKVKGPEVDFNLSKPEVDIAIPGANYEFALPDVELPSTKVEVKGPEIDLKLKDGKGSPSKFKMPSFKFPKFGAASPNISVEIPEVEKEITLDRELNIPEAKVEITAPNVEIEGPSIDLKSTGIDGTGKGGKFKMPNLGITMPKVKGPESDFSVSKPDVNVTLPKAKTDVTLTDVELPSAKVEVKGPEIETEDFDGSSTFKMPKFKLPKFGTGSSSITAEMPEVDKQIKFDAELNIPRATVDITAPKVEVEGPSLDLKSTGTEGIGKGSKIKMPSLGLSMPKVKGPEVDFNLSKPEVDITLPESKYGVALPDVELTSTEVVVKGPEIDPKLKESKGSPSKFKMPSFKFPKFGAASPNISVEIPEVEKEITLDRELNIPEAKVEITAPNVDIEGPSIDLKSTGIDGTGKGGKFKMPNLGISMPKVKRPEIDFSVSKPDVNVTLPKAKADVTLTDVELPSAKVEVKGPEIETEDFDGSSTFKMPKFKLPKFGTGSSSITAETPEVDKQIKFDAELNIPKATVDITAPKVEVEGPSIDLKSTGTDGIGKGSRIKMPSLGLSMPKVKGPEVDFNLSKPEVDITLPESKYEVALPDVELTSPKVEVKGSEIDLKLKDGKGSPSKFKMPSFKFPKFGAASPNISVEIPEVEKEITLDGELNIPEAKVEITAPIVDIEGPSIDLKSTGIDGTGKGGKFKMPNLGISMPKVKGPDIDFSVSKPDVNVTLPKAKADVTLTDVELPSAKVEVKGPEIETEYFDGSSTFKMPKFKLPKFGTGSSSITAEMPEVDNQIKFDAELNIPKATVDITAPKVEFEGPSIDLKSTGPDGMGKGSKIKMPSLGLSMPKVDSNVSKPEMDITIPGAKYEVALPDVELPSTKVEVKGPEIDLKLKDGKGSPSKYKMPSFKFPKFGASSANMSVEIPEVEKEIKLDGELDIPEARVEITAPNVDIEGPSIDVKRTGIDGTGKGSKFKMPNLGISMPKAKGPDIDVSVSKPDVDITLPKAKADVTLPDVELTSTKVEVKGPEIDLKLKDGKGSPSKYKMPSFKLPKFGAASPNISVEIPVVEKEIKLDGELNIPEAKMEITAPNVDIEGPSIDLKSTGIDGTGKGGKFKMPNLGISMPKVKGPDIDFSLSKPDVNITLPKAKADVTLTDVELPSAKLEMKGPEMDTKDFDGSSTFKMPKFKLPKFGTGSSSITAEIPEVDKQIKFDAELNIPKAIVDITAPKVEVEGPSIDLKSTGPDGMGKGSKIKMANLGPSMPKVKGPEGDFSVSMPDTEDFDVKSKMPELAVSEVKAFGEPGACAKEDHVSVKQAGWSFPSFSFSKTKDQGINASVESHQIGIRLPDTKKKIHSSDDEGDRKKNDFLVEALPSVELETNLKKASSKDHETDANMKELDGFLLRDKMRQMEISEVEGQGSEIEGHFEVTTHSVCIEAPSVNMTKTTGTYLGRKDLKPKEPENVTQPEFDLNLSKRDDFQGKEAEVDKEVGKASATLTALEVCTPEEDVKVKKSWFSLPRFSFSKQSVKETGYKSPEMETKMVLNVAVGSGIETNVLASPIVTEEVEKQDKEIKTWEQTIPLGIKVTSQDMETRDLNAELQTSKPKCPDDIMFPSHDIKIVAPNTDSQNPDTLSPVNGSPSKFKLPSFKMPTLKPEDEYLPVDTVCKDDQLETKAEPQELVKFIDDESNVSSTEEMERNPPPSNEEISLTNKDVIKSQPKTQNYTLPNPEPVGLFKFPRFGFSTPPGRSPESLDEDLSTAGSIQSSDAFADASSTATSEHTGVSFTSPSKVTVTYSGPDAAVELGALHSTIITSTTRSAQISFEPNLPEMFTILSSGVSSSSVDTLKLESDQIHVIRSNIQATPQVQKSTILTNFNVQSPLEMSKNPEFREATSWFEGAPQEHSGVASVERHITREVSSQEMRTLSRGTVVITQQLTVSGDQVEPIAEDTAGSVKRLRDTVHSEKMRFFEGAHS